MFNADFYEWLVHHKRYYPGLRTWLEKMSLDESEGVLAAWKRILACVSLSSAMAASERLYEADSQPKGYERHAAEVKRIALHIEQKNTGSNFRQSAVRCKLCHDDGRVCVYVKSTELYRQYVKQYGPNAATMEVRIACSCEAGLTKYPHNKLRHDEHSIVSSGPWGCLSDEAQKAIIDGPNPLKLSA